MFCPKCGNPADDNSRFCGFCGHAFEQPNTGAAQGQNYGSAQVQNTYAEPVYPNAAQNYPGTEYGGMQPNPTYPNAAYAPAYAYGGAVQAKKSGKKLGLIIGGIAAGVVLMILLILAIVFGGRFLRSRTEDAYVYYGSGSYRLFDELDADGTIELSPSRSYDVDQNMVTFSPDGQYVYFFTKIDDAEETGTLCRAEYKKFKKNSAKNSKHIEIIGTNIRPEIYVLKNGSILYMNSDNSLFLYDGKEVVQIARNVEEAGFDKDEKYIIYRVPNMGDYISYDLFCVELKDPSSPKRLVSDVRLAYIARNADTVYYQKEEGIEEVWDEYAEEYDYIMHKALYSVQFGKDPVKVADDATVLHFDYENGNMIYSVSSGKSICLYDLVIDDFQAADEGLALPEMENFGIETYRYMMVQNDSKDSYGDLYTSCTLDLYWLSRRYSMEEALDKYWGENTEALYAELTDFIEKYKHLENEDGLIPVTEEVKAALMRIVATDYDEEAPNAWLYLCYEKQSAGTSIDYDAYDEAYYAYAQAEDRIELRRALQDEQYFVNDIYGIRDGESNLIAAEVLDWRSVSGGMLYNTLDMISETIRIEEISDIYDVRSLCYVDEEDQNYIINEDDFSVYQMSENAAYMYSEASYDGYASLTLVGSQLFMEEDDSILSVAEIRKGVVNAFEYVSDDAAIIALENDDLYYISGTYELDGDLYGDLYLYSNDKSTLLATDIMMETELLLYEDGAVLAVTGQSYFYDQEYTLFMPNGESKWIGDSVTDFVRTDEDEMLYIADGILYSVKDDEVNTIAFDAELVWSCNEVEIKKEIYLRP